MNQALSSALSFAEFGPAQDAEHPQDWAPLAAEMLPHCVGHECCANAAARILAVEVRRLQAWTMQNDIPAFLGIREIIGDPGGKLMQDEVAARIRNLVTVLRETVGLMNALIILGGFKSIGAELKDMLETAMPDYDAVCKVVHEAEKSVSFSIPEPLKA
jgi:hypothetical protein